MTKQELIKGMEEGKLALRCETSDEFYAFCDWLSKDCHAEWYDYDTDLFSSSISDFCRRYSEIMNLLVMGWNNHRLNAQKPFRLFYIDGVLPDATFYESHSKRVEIVDWRDIDNNCANFEGLL